MPRMKSTFLGVLAVALLGTIGVTPASAEDYEISGGTLPQKTEGSGGTTKLKSTLKKAGIVITCNKSKTNGEFEEEGDSKGELVLEECSIGNGKETFTNCEVANIKLKTLGGLTNTKESTVYELILERTTESAIDIKNKGGSTCEQKGQYPIDGTQACEMPKVEALAKEHEIKCATSGSELHFNGESATLEGAGKVKLTSGLEWKAKVVPMITVSAKKVVIEGAELNHVFKANFVFTNHGVGAWTPIVGRRELYSDGVNGARFAVPTNTCLAGVAEFGTCEVVMEIEPKQKEVHFEVLGLTNAGDITLYVKTV
jgi:hypothetical protein